ncbi:response regulator transcription factor [Ruania alba]|uniref:DNA-binding response regulator, NarL/FixJ family, contains REC and HTH domains n=1 Tax=Ruania alba TaxID=648782 RepID=A0A1H5G3F0_9MICO|nr:response regulator transcription factor [Ruania alba]SEE09934.1 DNA-binding response regulator, NarL/FixJ family, contains REC and HTH domains [Ruania alba]
MISVLLVDDEPLIRQGIRMILAAEPDLDVVGEAGDGAEAVEVAARLRPDVILMDVRMPRVDGLRATELLLRKDDPPKVLVLTTFGHDDYVEAALRAGASGFLLKRSTAEQVVNAVRTVADGQSLVFPDQVRALLTTRPGSTWHGPRLTDRELEVLALVAEGLTNAEIASHLVLGVETVRTHVAHLIGKLSARDRTNAVVVAWTHGLLPRGG